MFEQVVQEKKKGIVRDHTTHLKLNKIYAQKVVNITESIKFPSSTAWGEYLGKAKWEQSMYAIFLCWNKW